MKKLNIIFKVSLSLLTFMEGASVLMYLFQYDYVSGLFENLGYPTYLVIPLAIAKTLGLVALWIKKYPKLKEWAYAGFTFDFLLAASAHLSIQDGEFYGAVMALILLLTAYVAQRKIYELNA